MSSSVIIEVVAESQRKRRKMVLRSERQITHLSLLVMGNKNNNGINMLSTFPSSVGWI